MEIRLRRHGLADLGQRPPQLHKAFYPYAAQAQVFRLTFTPAATSFVLTTSNGKYAGGAQVTLTAIDGNHNGQLENNELNNQAMSSTLYATCGTGLAACGGDGTLTGAGSLDAVTSPLAGALNTSACTTPVREGTWGLTKKIFRD